MELIQKGEDIKAAKIAPALEFKMNIQHSMKCSGNDAVKELIKRWTGKFTYVSNGCNMKNDSGWVKIFCKKLAAAEIQ